MVKKQIKLYNVIFPVWLLLIFPLTWIVVIPFNFMIDLAVIVIVMKLLKMKDVKLYVRKSIWKVVAFGFLADIIGGIFMVLPNFLDPFMSDIISVWVYRHLIRAVMYDPFRSVWGFLYVVVCMAISAVCIYFFNFKFSFNNTDIAPIEKKKIALALAIFTAPYLFLVPYDAFNF